MATFIKKLSDNEILVNDKLIYIENGEITEAMHEILNFEQIKAANNFAKSLKESCVVK